MASVIIQMQTLAEPFHRAPCVTLLENIKNSPESLKDSAPFNPLSHHAEAKLSQSK